MRPHCLTAQQTKSWRGAARGDGSAPEYYSSAMSDVIRQRLNSLAFIEMNRASHYLPKQAGHSCIGT
jgi:hypothetical protein